MSFNPNLVQLRFIYERDKYLLKEVAQEMGLKTAVEVTQTDCFLQFRLLNAECKNKPALKDMLFLFHPAVISKYCTTEPVSLKYMILFKYPKTKQTQVLLKKVSCEFNLSSVKFSINFKHFAINYTSD